MVQEQALDKIRRQERAGIIDTMCYTRAMVMWDHIAIPPPPAMSSSWVSASLAAWACASLALLTLSCLSASSFSATFLSFFRWCSCSFLALGWTYKVIM